MSYLPPRSGLGDAASLLASASSDPYLSEVICRIEQLSAVQNHRAAPSCATLRDGMPGGIGLRRAVKPLRGLVWAEQHPWIYPVAAVGIIGLPFLIGMMVGRRRSP